jgi:hypothetical protein
MSNKEEIGLWKKPQKSVNILNGAKMAKDKFEGKGEFGYNEDNSINKILKSLYGEGSLDLLKKYQKVYEWVNNNIKEIVKIWAKEFGSKTITLWIYFIELRKAIHDCIQVKFGFNNVILNVREDGGDYRSYFTCSLINETSPEERVNIHSRSLDFREILEKFNNGFMPNVPWRQLMCLNSVYPKFLSDFGPDRDPHLTVELTFERGIGTYAKLFFDQKDRYRSYSYQPIYADQEREVCTIIVRPEECLDIYRTIRELEEMAGCKSGDARLLGRVDLEVDIETTPFVGGTIAACDFVINAIRYGGIDNNIVKRYIYGCENIFKMMEGSGASAIIKGKDKKAVQDNIDTHLSSIQNIALDNVYRGKNFLIASNEFGFDEEIIYGDDIISIPSSLAIDFKDKYLRFRHHILKQKRIRE